MLPSTWLKSLHRPDMVLYDAATHPCVPLHEFRQASNESSMGARLGDSAISRPHVMASPHRN